MSPTAVVAAQMDALQMNDWPEMDAGARTAFAFTKPHDVESPTRAPAGRNSARSWHGHEDWLPFPEFSNMLHSPPLHCLLNCDQWQAVSPLTFTSSTRESKAVQAVERSIQGMLADSWCQSRQLHLMTALPLLSLVDICPVLKRAEAVSEEVSSLSERVEGLDRSSRAISVMIFGLSELHAEGSPGLAAVIAQRLHGAILAFSPSAVAAGCVVSADGEMAAEIAIGTSRCYCNVFSGALLNAVTLGFQHEPGRPGACGPP
ncbi:hypothetical protein WJX74_001690 [Apatococcus lobatus]|uniref:Uncharacterized protein n=1 Tax=Apatococcus lobatus TaxID=904363 RepID=A0AAW1RS70_9CHLO